MRVWDAAGAGNAVRAAGAADAAFGAAVLRDQRAGPELRGRVRDRGGEAGGVLKFADPDGGRVKVHPSRMRLDGFRL